MRPKNINCVALCILPEWIIFEITHFSKMTKILPFSTKKWENCQWNESFSCTYDFLRIRYWMHSLFNHKHWVSFRQHLSNICWPTKKFQISEFDLKQPIKLYFFRWSLQRIVWCKKNQMILIYSYAWVDFDFTPPPSSQTHR